MIKPLRDERTVFRTDSKLRQRMLAVEKTTGIALVDILVQTSSAICDYVEQHGSLTMPLVVVPRAEFEKLQAQTSRKKI